MSFFRKIGKLLRGAATPFQIWLACLLGALLGFVPGFTRAPALTLGLLLLLLILNANLFVAGLVGGLAKLASLALIGVSFQVGQWLLDGPTRGLFVSLINAPVTAWGGFEYYVCTGGLALGLLFGLVAGWVVSLPLKLFRSTMGRVEAGSSLYDKFKGNALLRFLFWVLFGPRHQWESYRVLLGKTVGNPIRIGGVVVAAVLVAALWFGQGFLSGPFLASHLTSGLEAVNGATVDVGAVELELGRNRLAIHDLALADKHDLATDLFRAKTLECDLSGVDLLRRRFKIDRIVASEASHGARRATPGVPIGPPPGEATPAPPPASDDEKTLDDWIAEAKVWKERLSQTREWLDKLKRKPAPGEESQETLEERLAREAAAMGYANVVASHLIEGAPTVQVGELIVEGMQSDKLGGRPLDLTLENLSTDPGQVDAPPRLKLRTRDGLLVVAVALGTEARVPGESSIDVHTSGLPIEPIAAQIEAKTGTKPLSGGTLDAGFRLTWNAGGGAAFDTPLDVKVKDTTLTLGKLGSTAVKELTLPLHLRGPLDNPRVKIDAEQLADNLLATGATELGNRLKQEATKRVTEALEDVMSEALEKGRKDAAGKLGDEAKKTLEGLNPFGKKKKDDPKKDPKKDDGSKPPGG